MLTPERYKEIKSQHACTTSPEKGIIECELLAEIDRLRAKNNDLEYTELLERVLIRFAGLLNSLEDHYDDSVVIRCEVTAGDLRALEDTLVRIKG